MVRKLPAAAAGLAALAAVYQRVFRRWALDWGSSPAEAARRLPGDELLLDPDVVATRAITIGAPPSVVWPWLVQMGPDRS